MYIIKILWTGHAFQTIYILELSQNLNQYVIHDIITRDANSTSQARIKKKVPNCQKSATTIQIFPFDIICYLDKDSAVEFKLFLIL